MEDFVTFEIAKKLKEKGLREKCFATYTPYGGIFKFNEIDTEKIAHCDLNIKDFRKCYNCYKENNIDAPTISQVLKWLREEKKMHIIVEISDSGWYYTIYPSIRWENGKLKSDTYIMSFKNKESYEQAAIAGIEYVIDNLP